MPRKLYEGLKYTARHTPVFNCQMNEQRQTQDFLLGDQLSLLHTICELKHVLQ